MVDPAALWAEKALTAAARAARIDVRERIEEARAECADDIAAHMPEYAVLLDEALQCMLQFHKMVADAQVLSKERSVTACMISAARATACVVGVRHLLHAGLEDVGRTVARSLSETLDITLLCLMDAVFAQEYMDAAGEDSYDANAFWCKHLGRGKLAKRLGQKLRSAGLDDDRVTAYLGYSAQANERHSASVHSSMRSAFRSAAVPSLAHRGRFSLNIVGHVSSLSPLLVLEVAERCHWFAEVIVGLLIENCSVSAPAAVDQEPDRALPFFASFFVLQDCLEALAPDLQARYGQRPPRPKRQAVSPAAG